MKSVLVVEDSVIFHKVAANVFRNHATVMIAETIATARAIIENMNFHFDAIILDGRLPVDVGGEFGESTTLMSSVHQYRSGIPVFAASADNESNEILTRLGCIPTNKSTAMFTCVDHLQK